MWNAGSSCCDSVIDSKPIIGYYAISHLGRALSGSPKKSSIFAVRAKISCPILSCLSLLWTDWMDIWAEALHVGLNTVSQQQCPLRQDVFPILSPMDSTEGTFGLRSTLSMWLNTVSQLQSPMANVMACHPILFHPSPLLWTRLKWSYFSFYLR